MNKSEKITCRYCKEHMSTRAYKEHLVRLHLAKEAEQNFIGIKKVLCTQCNTKMFEFREKDHSVYCPEAQFSPLGKPIKKKKIDNVNKGDNKNIDIKKQKKNITELYHYCPVCKKSLKKTVEPSVRSELIRIFNEHFERSHRGVYTYPTQNHINTFVKGRTKKDKKKRSVYTLQGGGCSPR